MFQIRDYEASIQYDEQIVSLLNRVYVDAGFTDETMAKKMFSTDEVKKRGAIILAINLDGKIIGMVICARNDNPYRQVAKSNEAEMQLLAVNPAHRKYGVGKLLCTAFEERTKLLGHSRLVLSTQPTMKEAHRLYEKMGYHRNPTRDWSQANRFFWVYEKLV